LYDEGLLDCRPTSFNFNAAMRSAMEFGCTVSVMINGIRQVMEASA